MLNPSISIGTPETMVQGLFVVFVRLSRERAWSRQNLPPTSYSQRALQIYNISCTSPTSSVIPLLKRTDGRCRRHHTARDFFRASGLHPPTRGQGSSKTTSRARQYYGRTSTRCICPKFIAELLFSFSTGVGPHTFCSAWCVRTP